MIRFEHFPLSDTILSIGIFGVNRIFIQYFSYNSKSSLAGFILAAVSMRWDMGWSLYNTCTG
ncbi:hypothetical protein U471_04360 [Bacillus amyloliquefaciens CC178]|nr:hypothetical protein U471_04360 [Bacillus amyloliquefaciens CC178]